MSLTVVEIIFLCSDSCKTTWLDPVGRLGYLRDTFSWINSKPHGKILPNTCTHVLIKSIALSSVLWWLLSFLICKTEQEISYIS